MKRAKFVSSIIGTIMVAGACSDNKGNSQVSSSTNPDPSKNTAPSADSKGPQTMSSEYYSADDINAVTNMARANDGSVDFKSIQLGPDSCTRVPATIDKSGNLLYQGTTFCGEDLDNLEKALIAHFGSLGNVVAVGENDVDDTECLKGGCIKVPCACKDSTFNNCFGINIG